MNRQDFNYISRANDIRKASLTTRLIPLALLLLLVGGGGGVAVLLPVPIVWAQSNFDRTQDLGNRGRTVTSGSASETLSTLPTHHGDATITGNNDGD